MDSIARLSVRLFMHMYVTGSFGLRSSEAIVCSSRTSGVWSWPLEDRRQVVVYRERWPLEKARLHACYIAPHGILLLSFSLAALSQPN